MKKKLLLPLLLLAAGSVSAQVVSTYAGTPGTPGWAPSSVAISTATFSDPYGIVIDNADRIWITESVSTLRIRVIDPGSNTVYNKTGYFGDPNNAGASSYINGTGNVSRYASPRGIAMASDGTFYVCDYDNNAIRKITAASSATTNQAVSTFAGEAPPGGFGDLVDGTGTDARFDHPIDVAMDASGNLYVADNYNECIRKITPGGVVTTLAGSKGLVGDVDGTGSAARFNNITSIDILDANHIVITDCWNNKIKKINTSTGQVTTITGGTMGHADGALNVAQFHYPSGIAVDKFGNIYVCEGWDGQSNVIRRISGSTVTTIAGAYQDLTSHRDGQDTASRFSKPTMMAFNSTSDKLFVTDFANSVIRMITLKPKSDFSASPTSTNVGVQVNLNDLSKNGPTSWNWVITPTDFTYESGTSASSQNPKVKFTQTGTYTVRLTASNSYGSDELVKTGYINISSISATDPPVADFVASDSIGSPGDIIDFTDKSTNNPIMWQWTISPMSHIYVGGTTNASQNPSVQFTALANYTVILKDSNGAGSSVKVKINYIKINPLGVKNIGLSELVNIYPNPSQGTIYVESANQSFLPVMDVKVYNLSGQLVYAAVSEEKDQHAIVLRDLKPGMYMVTVSDGTNIFNKKIIIQ